MRSSASLRVGAMLPKCSMAPPLTIFLKVTQAFAPKTQLYPSPHPHSEIVMSSQRRIQSSRLNGARSRGPATPEGRAASSRNGTRHGILAKTVVFEGESKDRFEELLAELTEELQPQTVNETALVETMAIAHWRQMRIWAIQKSSFDLEMARPEHAAYHGPVRAAVVFRDLADNSRVIDLLQRYETTFDRQFFGALSLLIKLRTARNQKSNVEAVDGLPLASEQIASAETPVHPATALQPEGNSNLRDEPSPKIEHSERVQLTNPCPNLTADVAVALSGRTWSVPPIASAMERPSMMATLSQYFEDDDDSCSRLGRQGDLTEACRLVA